MAAAIAPTGAPGEPRPGLGSWHAAWAGLRFLVLGAGTPAFAVADAALERGGQVTVAATIGADHARILDLLGARVHRGVAPADVAALHRATVADIVVVTADADAAWWQAATALGVPVWSDLACVWRWRDAVGDPAWVVVGGSGHVATAVATAVTMLRAGGLRAFGCGIGEVHPLDVLRDPSGADVLVLGVGASAVAHLDVQGPGALQPVVSACLLAASPASPVSPVLSAPPAPPTSGLDGARLYANTRRVCLYHQDDPVTIAFVEAADVTEGARAVGVGWGIPGLGEVGMVEGIVCERAFHPERHAAALELGTLADLAAAGWCAEDERTAGIFAAAIARAFGVDPVTVATAWLRDGPTPGR